MRPLWTRPELTAQQTLNLRQEDICVCLTGQSLCSGISLLSLFIISGPQVIVCYLKTVGDYI